MRQVAHGVVWFGLAEYDALRVDWLMRQYNSCKRSAYQAIHRVDLKGNKIREYCKRNYAYIGQRYLNDAVSEAQKIQHDHVIFGSKKLWKEFQQGKITKDQWHQERNKSLYSRGDRTKQGNPNIRIVGDELWINDPCEHGKWLKGKLWLHQRPDLRCYDARITKDGNRYKVTISWDVLPVEIKTTSQEGVVGIDINPDGIALVETNGDGNLIHHEYLYAPRIQYAQQGKRQHDVRLLAKQVVDHTLKLGKSLVIEDLSFKKKKDKGRWFNRMTHNFLYNQITEAIESRAFRYGVEVIKVNPAFTSIIGILKYAKPLSLNRHTAAAFVIARKGQGFKESVKVVLSRSRSKEKVKLEARAGTISLTRKALTWMRSLFEVVILKEQPGVTPPVLVPD